MNKAAYMALVVFCVGFLVCLAITIPLLFWALRLEDEENGIVPARKAGRDVGGVIIVAIVLSLVWVLMLPLYVLMLAEKIAGRGRQLKEVKKDCFAYDKDKNKCHTLKRLYCEMETCKFYKTEEQVRKERGERENEWD
ncbi:hypothetical protein D7X88_12755 [bacterium C-53]|nr:hypothetical protein [Lachnospiraceae bacterium]NBI03884.1 hypothetical protein [Lachnospiraceae bacterium]RKJ09027.1 hypothetical protein D7X88_12755 [bacterium C-53]